MGKELSVLNPSDANSIYDCWTDTAPRNRRIKNIVGQRKRGSRLQKRLEEKNWIIQLGFRKYEKSWYSDTPNIENKINQLIDEINKKDSIIEADPLDSEVRILIGFYT